MLNCNHSFDWNNVKIVDSEPNYNKRSLRCYILENNPTVLIQLLFDFNYKIHILTIPSFNFDKKFEIQ